MTDRFQNIVTRTNLPNKVTIGRVLMIFVFLLLYTWNKYFHNPDQAQFFRAVAVAFAFLAGLTDLVDGWLARRYHVVTDFGKLMDPLADKIFITTTFILLVDAGLLPGWVAIVVLAREFLVTGLRLLATNKGEVIPADSTGKLKTFLQMMFLIFGGILWIGWLDLADAPIRLTWLAAYWIIVLITAYSGVNYFVRFRHLYLDNT